MAVNDMQAAHVAVKIISYSWKIWWIGLNQREQNYWWILIWRIAEFDLTKPRIWRLRVPLHVTLIKGSGLLQLPSIEQYGVETERRYHFLSGMFGLQPSEIVLL